MTRIKAFFVRILSRMAAWFGHELVAAGTLPPAGANMPQVDLKMTEGVRLLKMKVWTEGEKECQHDYRKVRPLNSHKFAVKSSSGQVLHSDYTCSKCTHRLCVSDWGGKHG